MSMSKYPSCFGTYLAPSYDPVACIASAHGVAKDVPLQRYQPSSPGFLAGRRLTTFVPAAWASTHGPRFE